MDPQLRPLEAGDPASIGPYTLLGVLGSGGMGRGLPRSHRAGTGSR
jgi:hypothetical protein